MVEASTHSFDILVLRVSDDSTVASGGSWLPTSSYTIAGQSSKLRMTTRNNAVSHLPGEIPPADR